MKKYKDLEEHICRFNDGECVCECFDEGYEKALEQKEKEMIKKVKKLNDDYGFDGVGYKRAIEDVLKELKK